MTSDGGSRQQPKRWSVERRRTAGWAVGAYIVRPRGSEHDLAIVLRLGRGNLDIRRKRTNCPWPTVPECHRDYQPGHTCPQHDGAHAHVWAVWPTRFGEGPATRCIECGGRKCDNPRCLRLRHHSEPHTDYHSYLEPIGGMWISHQDRRSV